MRILYIAAILLILPLSLAAQITPVPLADRLAEAEIIAEVEVLDAVSFWDATGANIHTSHLLRVRKLFKGTLSEPEIEIFTMGGRVGMQIQHTSHELRLRIGESGLLLCSPSYLRGSPRGLPPELRMEAVAAQQGFIRYDALRGTASDPFDEYGEITTGLYPRIIMLTGQPWREMSGVRGQSSGNSLHKGGGNEVQALAITGLSGPHPAGNRTVLTITGTDFGSSPGTVSFRSADNASTAFEIDTQSREIILWTDTQIQCYVPPDAGSGPLQVTTAGPSSQTTTSSAQLSIPYSRLAWNLNNIHWTTDHVDDNGNGGYTWRMNTTFAGNAARRAAFIDQLEAWRCATTTNRVNWDVGPDTSLAAIAADGVNIAMMGGLPGGVLGRCTSRWYLSYCPPDTVAWLYEMDIAFGTAYSWEYTGTPASGVYDFRSVALHELGHGMQLGHAAASAQVMYYAIGSGTTKRVLQSNDIAGAQNAMDASVAANPCGGIPITAQLANAGPDLAVCTGGSKLLVARGGTQYAWTIPPSSTVLSTDAAYTASPASTTTYRVTVSNSTCALTSSDDVTVTVQSPLVSNAGPDVGICPSGSASIGNAGVSASDYTSTGSTTGTGSTILFRTGARDCRTQFLFTAAELQALGMSAGFITRLSFSIASGNTATQAMNGFNVRLAHTSATALNTGFQSASFTTVYSASSYTPSGSGWQPLDLQPWFQWNGLDNLLVEVCFDNNSSGTSYVINLTGHGSSFLTTYNYSSQGGVQGCTLGSAFISTARPLTRFTVASEGYSWSPASGLSNPYVSNPTASPAATTTYTLTTTTSAGCADTDQVTVTMHPANPTALTWDADVDSDWGTVGNWDSPCATPDAGDAVTIPSGVTPPTGVPSLTLASLAVDNSGGISLANPLTVTGTLTLSSGTITLSNDDLTIGGSGSISGGGASSHVVTTGSGMLVQQNLGSGGRSGSVLFPVGSSTTYTPVTLQNSGTADAFGVRVLDGVRDGGLTGTPLTTHAVAKTWDIEESVAGGSNATVTLQWNAGDELSLFSRGSSYVAHHDGSTWSALQAPSAASGSNPYTQSATGVSSFSPFSVGDNASPLPVELTAFTGRFDGQRVALQWRTATELSNYGFHVQRRTERTAWTTLAFVRGSGTVNTPQSYDYIDGALPPGSQWHYRLRQEDRDGTVTYGPEITVTRAQPASVTLSPAWPQPASATAHVRVTMPVAERVQLILCDMAGREILRLRDERLAAGTHLFRIPTGDLRTGSYMLLLRGSGSVQRSRLVVLR